MKLSAVRLFVRELALSKAFYAEVLGLRLTDDGSEFGYCCFESGDILIIVEVVAAEAPAEDQALVGRFSGLSFAVTDIEGEFRRLSALGVRFNGPPEMQFWGGRTATFQDPSRNELQLAQYAA